MNLLGTIYILFMVLVCSLITYRVTRKISYLNIRKLVVISMFFLLNYVSIVSESYFRGTYYEYELTKYDIDGDGIFSENESTPEQQAAMNKVIADTDRVMAVFTAFPISGILTLLFYFVLRIKKLWP